MRKALLAALAVLVGGGLANAETPPAKSTSSESDWPMWRGPRGDGVSLEADAPLRWSSDQNVVWKTRIPGTGYSSPIIHGDVIFVTSADLETQERTLYCIGREQGDIRWKRVVAEAPIERMHRLNSPASGTPATDGERVYVAFQTEDAILAAAYDYSGEQVWKVSPGGFQSRHGFHTCPILFEDSILLSGMQDSADAFLARIHRETGEIIWKAFVDSPIRSFSSPMPIEVEGKTQIILSGADRTYAFAATNGRPIWRVQGPAQKTVSSLSFDGEHVLVPGGRDKKLFAIRPTGTGDVTETHISWVARSGIPYISSPVLYEGQLHVLSDDGVYTRLNLDDGGTESQSRLTTKLSSSPIAVAGRIYATSEAGRTTVVSAKTNEVLAENDLGEEVYATLAVAGGEIFIRGKEHLFRIRDRSTTR